MNIYIVPSLLLFKNLLWKMYVSTLCTNFEFFSFFSWLISFQDIVWDDDDNNNNFFCSFKKIKQPGESQSCHTWVLVTFREIRVNDNNNNKFSRCVIWHKIYIYISIYAVDFFLFFFQIWLIKRVRSTGFCCDAKLKFNEKKKNKKQNTKDNKHANNESRRKFWVRKS